MIKVIIGNKGHGKTKRLIELVGHRKVSYSYHLT